LQGHAFIASHGRRRPQRTDNFGAANTHRATGPTTLLIRAAYQPPQEPGADAAPFRWKAGKVGDRTLFNCIPNALLSLVFEVDLVITRLFHGHLECTRAVDVTAS
jgi:hypothetical protein